ncbi:hypothetical protein MIZ03_4583 [Rhodoferax lithotrophicus]|uniref:glucose-6-phosphate 1-epimerase n=2 Tax=Rhodoferax lithotrophicus TaxID=2798804 RepID=A0ABM7MTR8_9BURK|nr:hypothetical protein MIZ03_4583 [Rhodoferax sp. MIZ03]
MIYLHKQLHFFIANNFITNHMPQSLETLNSRFGLTNTLFFANHAAGLPVAEIQTPLARAHVALHGAHVLAWQPAGQQPVIWVSQAARYEPGQAVRGGVPVCWPWFGARDGLPAHGFVRTRLWHMRETSLDADGQVRLRLGISDDASTRALWNHAFDLELIVTVGQTLTMALVTRNTGTQAFTLTDALHTYFGVADIAQTTVRGLEGCTYLDKVQNFAECSQTGVVSFSAETDRVYVNTSAECVIDDRAGQRQIHVAKQGSTSTVVWNPWSEREKSIADMAAGEHRRMLCVETCNAGPDKITLAAQGIHTLTARISVA